MTGRRQVFTVAGEIQPDLGLGSLAIGIGEFAEEHLRVLPLAESFRDIGSHAARVAADLIGERIPFIFREGFAFLKYLHRQFVSQLIHLQIAMIFQLLLY